TVQYDFALRADTLDLADLRWVQPDFPAWTGRGRLTAHSTSNRHTDFILDSVDLGRDGARARGRLTALLDEDRGVGVRDLDLRLSAIPLAVVRPFLDTLPFDGWLSGD